jgi:outer membrane lipoprotein-sorting protein
VTTCVGPRARARRHLSSGALAIVLAACATVAPPEPARIPDETRRLVALLTLRHHHIADVKSLVEVTLRQGAAAQRFSGVLLARAPDRLRFEALSPFGQPFLLVTVADGTLTRYHVGDNRTLIAPADARTTGRWLGVPLGPDDLLGLLIGRPLPPRDLREAELLPADARGRSLRLAGHDQTQRVWLDVETGVVSRIEIQGGRRMLAVTYEQRGGAGIPTAIRATAETDLEALIRYRDPVLSAGVDPALFQLTVPASANTERLR